MSVSFVTTGSHAVQTGATSLTATFNIGTCDALAVFVGVNSAITLSSPAWNSVAMFAPSGATEDDGNSGRIAWFALQAPTTGSATFTCTASASTTYNIGFASFSGVNQTGGASSFANGASHVDGAGTGSTASLSITTAAGDATVCGWAAGNVFASAATQSPTADWQISTPGFPLNQAQHTLSAGTSDPYNASISPNVDFLSGAGFRLIAAAAATVTLGRLPSTLLLPPRRGMVGWRGLRQLQAYPVSNIPVGISLAITTQSKTAPGASFTANLSARIQTQAKASAAPTGLAAMGMRVQTALKSASQISGAVPLSMQITTQAKAASTTIFATFISMRIQTAAQVASAMAGAAALSMRVTTQAKASPRLQGAVGLAMQVTTQAKALGALGTGGFVQLSMLVTTMAKAAGRQAGAAALSLQLTTQTKEGLGNPVQPPPSGQFQLITSLGGVFNPTGNPIG